MWDEKNNNRKQRNSNRRDTISISTIWQIPNKCQTIIRKQIACAVCKDVPKCSKDISNEFKDILFLIVEDRNFNNKLFNLLTDGEKDYLNRLHTRSGVKHVKKLRLDNQSEYEKNKARWAVVQGMINAGNDSTILNQEAKDLLKYFVDNKTISIENRL